MLSGAREILNEFMAALEEWEETHESVLKEAHEQDALEVVRSAQWLFNATQWWWVRAGRQAGSFSAVSMPTFASQHSLEYGSSLESSCRYLQDLHTSATLGTQHFEIFALCCRFPVIFPDFCCTFDSAETRFKSHIFCRKFYLILPELWGIPANCRNSVYFQKFLHLKLNFSRNSEQILRKTVGKYIVGRQAGRK